MIKLNIYFTLSFIFFSSVLAGQNPTLKKTDSKISVSYQGINRYFYIHIPTAYHKKHKLPVVFILHSGGENALEMINLTHFNELADKDTALLVYPNANNDVWNDGRFVNDPYHGKKHIDDVGYLQTVIKKITTEFKGDPDNIFFTGMASGAMMCYKFACESAGQIKAIAPVLGSMPELVYQHCKPTQSISIIAINGDMDPLIPLSGGEIEYGDKKYGIITSVEDALNFWANLKDTIPSAHFLIKKKDLDKKDGTTVFKKHIINETFETDIVLYLVHNGGHSWPGSKKNYPKEISKSITKDINATELIWEFFKVHWQEK